MLQRRAPKSVSRSNRRSRLTPLALAAALALGSTGLNAAQRQFIGGGSFWDTLNNWQGGLLPGAGDDALLGTFDTEIRTAFTINSVTGTGSLTIGNAGSLSFASASSIGALQLTGGTMSGAGSLVVGNAGSSSSWTGGTITGTGTTTVNGDFALGGNTQHDLTGGRVLNTTGTTFWSNSGFAGAGRIRTGGGAAINNSGLWFDANSVDSSISADFGGSSAFANSNIYIKSGTGTTNIQIAFNNSGTVSANAGVLRLSGGGTNSGAFGGSTGTLEFGGGTYNVLGAASVTVGRTVFSGGTTNIAGQYHAGGTTVVTGGTANFTGTLVSNGGVLQVSGGTANFSNAAPVEMGTLSLSGGDIAGTQTLTITGPASWTGGGFSGSGRTVFNGAAALVGGSVHDVTNGRRIDFNGTTTWDNTSGGFADAGRIRGGGGSVLTNNGSWLDQNSFSSRMSNDFGGVQPTFTNAGSYTKSGSAQTDIGFAFDNSGTVSIHAGTLRLSGGGTSSGSIGGGGALEFGGGTHNLGAASSIAVPTVSFTSGTTNIAGGYNVPGSTSVSGGTANFTGNVANSGAALNVSAGAANFNSLGGVAFSALTLSGGSLGGTQTVTVSGPTTWTSGAFAEPGRTVLNGAVAISGTSAHDAMSGRRIDFNGTTTWANSGFNDAGRIRTGSGAVLTNNGSWLDQNTFSTRFSNDFGGVGSTFVNAGSYVKSGSALTDVNIGFDNSGTVSVNAGTLRLSGGGTSAGGRFTGTGTLEFGGGTHNISAGIGASIALPTVVFSGGTVNLAGSYDVPGSTTVSGGTANFNGVVSGGGVLNVSGGGANFNSPAGVVFTALNLSGGTVGGAQTVTIDGPGTWTAGGFSDAGTALLNGTLAISGTAPHDVVQGRTLTTAGTTTWTNTANDAGRLRTGSGATIRNTGSWLDQLAFNGRFSNDFGGVPSSFVNVGTYTKSGPAITDFGIAFTNQAGGVLNVNVGTAAFSGGSSAGTINLAAGALLNFGSGTFTVDGTVSAATGSRVLVSGGNVDTVGPKTIAGTVEVINGSFNPSAATGVGTLVLSGGTIGGSGALTVTGGTTWTGGTMTAAGTTTTAGGLTLSGGSPKDLIGGRTLHTQATTTWSNTGGGNGAIRTGGGSTIRNEGTWNDAQAFAGSIANAFGGAASSFVNTGRYEKAGAGSTDIAVGFTSSGAVSVSAGSLALSGAFTNFSGTTLTGGSIEVIGNSTFRFTGANVVTNASSILLDGAGSAFLNHTNNNNGLANFATNAAAGSFTIRNGRNFTTAGIGTFNNAGLLTVGSGSTFTWAGLQPLANTGSLVLAGGTLVEAGEFANLAGGTVSGFGSVQSVLGNAGLVRASGGTLGVSGGIALGTGNVAIDAGAALNLSSATSASSARVLDDAGSLNLGAQNLVVALDYANANFGAANSFDARAGVIGAGLIVGQDAALSISGSHVVPAGTNTVILDFGNVRGGGATTRTFQVANSGTGASLRGALQTAGAGSISDPRLSGSGVAATLFGPIAAGGNGGDLSITLAAGAAGGSLVGQSLNVVSNFGNVAPWTIQLGGFSTVLARGQAMPVGPLDLGRFRVGMGSELSGLLAATNLTSGFGAERLGIAGVTASGSFAAVNNLGAGLVAPGATAAGAVGVGTLAGGVGVNNGNVAIQFSTNGTAFDAGFTSVAANLQNVALVAAGYLPAQPALPVGPVNVGNYRVTAGASGGFLVSNIDAAPAGFQELLNVNAAATSAGVTLAGSAIGLAPGATSAPFTIGFAAGGALGPRSGSGSVALVSDGAGTSGLGLLSLGNGTVNVIGTAFGLAVPTVDTTPVTLAARVGDAAPSRAIGVGNGAGSFTESLNASFVGTPPGFAGSGTVTGLAPGAASNALQVSLSTASAGSFGGNAGIALASSGVGTTNAPDASLGTTNVPLTGRIWAPAVAVVNTPTVVDFGIVRVGDVVSPRNVSISNGANSALNDTLRVALGGGGAPFTTSGAIGALAAGGTDASSLAIQLATTSAGIFSGSAALGFTSQNPDLADLPLAGAAITLHGQVNSLARVGLGTAAGAAVLSGGGTSFRLDFGTIQIGGGSLGSVLQLSNTAFGPADALSGSWDLSGVGVGSAFTLTGFTGFAGLTAGSSIDGLAISFADGAEGVFDGVLVLRGISTNGSGPDLSLPELSLELHGSVVAVPEPGTLVLWAAGLLMVVRLARRRLPQQAATASGWTSQ